MRKTVLIAATLALTAGLSGTLKAQDQGAQDADAFTSENAIVNTAVPFAIGAREARQELRGAFGWPTFQEGLVEGVYFRFDPDGYARFSPTPRLDTDVFEVICRPGTLNCLGRKGTMSVFLNGQGALQLQLDDVSEGDTLSIVEGVTILPLPPRVLQPLDARLETLLGSGGELVVKRGEAEFARFSLTGFSAVAAYLRWITAKQDYDVLPRGWPVPNSGSSLTTSNAVDWQAPIRNGLVVPTTDAAASGQNPVANDVAEVRGELNVLRELLVSRNAADVEVPAAPPVQLMQAAPAAIGPNTNRTQIQMLQAQAQTLLDEIARLQNASAAPMPTALSPNAELSMDPMVPATNSPQYGQVDPAAMSNPIKPNAPLATLMKPEMSSSKHQSDMSPARAITDHLEYLMNEIGLDPQTALLLVQATQTQTSGIEGARPILEMDSLNQSSRRNAVVMEILGDLRAQLPENHAEAETENASMEMPVASETMGMDTVEFQLLTDYFESVFSDRGN